MSKKVKTLLVKLLVLAFALIVADLAGGLVLKYLFNKQRSGKYFTTSHAIKDGKEQVLIFGNSHAAQHFDAPLMAKTLSKSVFNFGNQGQSLLYTYPLVKTVLSRYQPELIILNLDYNELRYDPTDYERLAILLPYYHANSVIDSTISLIPDRAALKAKSHLYRYNSTLGYIFLNTYGHSYGKSTESLGYDPVEGDMCAGTANYEEADRGKIAFDKNKIDYLIKLISYIQSKQVKLLITTTPLIDAHENEKNVHKEKLLQLLTKMNVNYLDYGSSAEFKGKCKLFHDTSHLNATGAALWTKTLLNDLPKYFDQF